MDCPLLGSHWFLRSTPRVLGRARHAVHSLLVSAGVGVECRERAVIACDELLVQAADDVAGQVMLSVCVASDHVRVAVFDANATPTASGSREEQRLLGLTLVWQLSRDFYVQALDGGRTVAAEITRYEFGVDENGGNAEPAPA